MSKNASLMFLVFALLYMYGMYYSVSFLWLLKVLPIILLFVVVFKTKPSSIRSILLCALVFSACGDLLLAFDQFIYGVAAFLLAQLSYAVIFKANWKAAKIRITLSLGLIVYVSIMAGLLLPKLGELQIPVSAYLVAITAMGLLAAQSKLPFCWAVLGALLFIISDSFIAINKFIQPIPLAGYWVMSTYYLAQIMLVTGLLKSIEQKND